MKARANRVLFLAGLAVWAGWPCMSAAPSNSYSSSAVEVFEHDDDSAET